MTTATKELVAGRTLVPAELFELLVKDVVRDNPVDRPMAERIVDQALAFVRSADPDAFLRPSKFVDMGWHAFVLRTREYQEFCMKELGWFVHHSPDVEEAFGTEGRRIATETIKAIEKAGYVVDMELWDNAAGCGESGCGAGRPPVTV